MYEKIVVFGFKAVFQFFYPLAIEFRSGAEELKIRNVKNLICSRKQKEMRGEEKISKRASQLGFDDGIDKLSHHYYYW